MRGSDIRTGDLFSYVDLEQRVPANHPLRLIRRIVNEVLAALDSEFGRLYATEGHDHNAKLTLEIETVTAKRKAIHAVVDNYATHKHPKVREWLARHPRWTFHFTPTSASWLNAVETFFAKLTIRRLIRGVFRSVDDLQAAINRFVLETNAEPKPFIWTADPNRVLAAVKRGKQGLKSIH